METKTLEEAQDFQVLQNFSDEDFEIFELYVSKQPCLLQHDQ